MSNELLRAADYKTELDYAREVGKLVVKSGKWSKDWNEDTVAVLVLYARDLGIHPVKALMSGFNIIQGKIEMKPILMSDMIRKAGHSIQIVQNDDVCCVLKGVRKDSGDTCTISFSFEDAKKAGLTGKDNWNKWRADMLYNRAMGRLGRMLFSDIIGGAYTDGEMSDIQDSSKEPEIQATEVEVTPTVSETPKAAIGSRTFDDLHTEMQLYRPVSSEALNEFLVAFAEQKKSTMEKIINSALSSDEQMNKLCNMLDDYYKQPEPELEA